MKRNLTFGCAALGLAVLGSHGVANASLSLGYTGNSFDVFPRVQSIANLAVPSLPSTVQAGTRLQAYMVLPVDSNYSGSVNYQSSSAGFIYDLGAQGGYVLSNANSSIIVDMTLVNGIPKSWFIEAIGDSETAPNEIWASDKGMNEVVNGQKILTSTGYKSIDLQSLGVIAVTVPSACDYDGAEGDCSYTVTYRTSNATINNPGSWIIKPPIQPSYRMENLMSLADSGAPEPAAWSLVIMGLGAVGAQLRLRKLRRA